MDKSIQTDPTGLFGPAAIVKGRLVFTASEVQKGTKVVFKDEAAGSVEQGSQ
ncbi:hypothetical protein NKH52_25880 [Mesorhizobium sp. M1066]|uniref:hypothetical protein n=1 Tax=unclassified Mesorhizobium TaxID=325217 RepID=UPI0033384E7C